MSRKFTYDPVTENVINTLLYFDIFNYPLKLKEVYYFLQSNHVTPDIIYDKLCDLANQGKAFHFGDFFTLQNQSTLVERRIRGNREAERWMKLAERQAKLIQSFPFVQAVMASGSLSKGYMDENCDLDFFIITKPDRLWIARTLLVLYKRIFLKGSHKYFCVNYFVDENHLTIEEQNIFTSTELATLIPLTGKGFYNRLIKANEWVFSFLPNCDVQLREVKYEEPIGAGKKLMELIFNLFLPKFWNRFFMKLTLSRWRKLYGSHLPDSVFEVAFKTKAHVSKNHPNHFQHRVLTLYQKKKREYYLQDPIITS
jgi:hypothetical protein